MCYKDISLGASCSCKCPSLSSIFMCVRVFWVAVMLTFVSFTDLMYFRKYYSASMVCTLCYVLFLLVNLDIWYMLWMFILTEFVLFWTFRQLHLILSMLLHRDEDAKSEATNNKEKEIISTITSIFQSIKHSEDVVHTSKVEDWYHYYISLSYNL